MHGMAWHWVGKKWASGFVAVMLRVKSNAIEWTYLFYLAKKSFFYFLEHQKVM
jgi:hypothetical protein